MDQSFPLRDDFSYPRSSQPADGMALNSVRSLLHPSSQNNQYSDESLVVGSELHLAGRFRGSGSGSGSLSLSVVNNDLNGRVEYLKSMRNLRNDLTLWVGLA